MAAPALLLLAGLGLLFASKKRQFAAGALATADDTTTDIDSSTADSTAPVPPPPAHPRHAAAPPPPAPQNGTTAPRPAPPSGAAPSRPAPPDLSHPGPPRPRPAWVDAWLAAHPQFAQRKPAPPPPRPGAPARPRPPPPVPHPAVLAQQVANLPPHLRPGAQIALQSGRPHLAARITEGAMRGESAASIAQNIAPHLAVSANASLPDVSATISAPDIGNALAQVFGQ